MADAPVVGRRRVDPGAIVTVDLTARVEDDAVGVRLVAAIPEGWSVAGADGGTIDLDGGTVTWEEGNLKATAGVAETVRLRAPLKSPTGRPAFDALLAAQLGHAGGTLDSASVAVRVAPEIIVDHVTFARIATIGHTATYLDADALLDNVDRYDTFRVRFQVRNADNVAVRLSPGLQWSTAGSTAFADVPVGGREPDVPFYIGTEWRPLPGGSGTLPGPEQEAIPASGVRVHDRDDGAQLPAPGEHLMGAQQVPTVPLAGDSYTEVEFTVRTTAAVELRQAYAFRLVDSGHAIVGAVEAYAVAVSQPELTLSPGQRNGIPVGPPVDATPTPVSMMDASQVVPATATGTWPEPGGTPIYRLAIALPTTPATRYPLNAGTFTSPHTPEDSLASDTCAICHRTHVAQAPALLAQPATQATMCFTCHDGTGSDLDTKAQYYPVDPSPTIPANSAGIPGAVPSKYFQHDALSTSAPTTHTLSTNNEFGGVLNRHAECADCHNSHNTTTTPSTQFSDGWSVSGRQAAISGVSVVNGAAGAAPTYTFLSGAAGAQPDREYQICLKCHSGFTTLPTQDAAFPSTWALDKAIELNPGNASYHPVEAAGTNGTDPMKWSLANSSPYKQWNFTIGSTVRCVNCHGDTAKWNATLQPGGTSETAAGDDLAPHASQYRGILIQNYRDRVLKDPDEGYSGADFALCYVCHAEEPYRSSTRDNTVFRDHDLHVSSNAGEGPGGTDIDTPGQGGGNALCAECHFRIHGTALAVNEGDRDNRRLVNFAPNVQPYVDPAKPNAPGVIKFVARSGSTPGSCTLTCHGEPHNAETYN